MRIAITGATGFVGRNLVHGLARDGHEVVTSGRSLQIGAELERAGIEFRAAELASADQVRSALDGAQLVIHCGGKSGPWGRYRNHFQANVVGTRNVIGACRAHGIERVLFVSTPSVYFTGRDRFDVTEDQRLPSRHTSHYATTKRMAEEELIAVADDGLRVIILRPRALHGPWDRIFIPRILGLAKGRTIPLVNGGGALVDVTFVGNLVDVVRLCLKAPASAWGEAYNVTNGEPLTVREWFGGVVDAFGLEFRPRTVPARVARIVAAAMEARAALPGSSRPPRMTRASVDYLAASMTLSIEKARVRLGYDPEVGNAEGFRRTAEWFQRRVG